ncbi:Ig-like domain-containing protein, partial [Protofrankia symbiont of Coriaria ruscifolia]|uniref:Ig-like domain-containing protein n=1 Tax=Protofrankia symbiont of Coriaria ruscifolia TaxID=1306542 RepID=UPI001F5E6B07
MRPTPVDSHTRSNTDRDSEIAGTRSEGRRLRLHAVMNGQRRQWLGIGAAGLVIVIVVGIILTRGGQGPASPQAATTAAPNSTPTEQAPARPVGPWVLAVGTSPLDGQSVKGSVEVSLNPGTDTLDKVERVKFSLDGDTVLDDRDAPFTVRLNNPAAGKHTLTARVRTNDGSTEVESAFTSTGDGADSAAPAVPAAPVPPAAL